MYCFPSAGAAAHAFTNWPRVLPPSIEVRAIQLPGRGPRIAEPLMMRMEPLADAVTEALLPELSAKPFALYGHSLGSLVAYEVARRLQAVNGPSPMALFLTGRRAPQAVAESLCVESASDEKLWDEVRQYNGTPDELLRDPAVRAYFLPIIRADFGIVERYRFVPGPRLDVPLHVAIGRDDASIPPGSADGWRELTTAGCDVETYDGGHFFNQIPSPYLSALSRQLEHLAEVVGGGG